MVCVANGREALRQVKEKEFDLIIMDVHMPHMNGAEALDKIKKMRPNQKIIMLSSTGDTEYHLDQEVAKGRLIACLSKPVELHIIEKAIEKALGPLPGKL